MAKQGTAHTHESLCAMQKEFYLKGKKPTYKYPDFVSNVELIKEKSKRYCLKLEINNNKTGTIIVILKNPSRANKSVSDKTVFNVSNYIYKNQKKYHQLKDVGHIIILNLIPNYLTDSKQLIKFKKTIINKKNISILEKYCKKHKNVIIAWGDSPAGLSQEYKQLKTKIKNILTENENHVFYVDKLTKANNPKHGQVWGYKDKLEELKEL